MGIGNTAMNIMVKGLTDFNAVHESIYCFYFLTWNSLLMKHQADKTLLQLTSQLLGKKHFTLHLHIGLILSVLILNIISSGKVIINQ